MSFLYAYKLNNRTVTKGKKKKKSHSLFQENTTCKAPKGRNETYVIFRDLLKVHDQAPEIQGTQSTSVYANANTHLGS